MIRKSLVWILATIAFAAVSFSAAQDVAPAPSGQAILDRACTVCHTIKEITKFKGYYGKDQWADIVRTMRGDGARLQDSEVLPLVEYLYLTYGRVDLPDGDGKKVLEASCGGCHDLANATKSRLSNSGWREVIGRMIGMGAKVDDSQIPILADYLAKNFGS